MKVDGSLKSLLQGVSQQPPRDRLPGQCTEQINMTADPVQGLARRAPTDLVSALNPTTVLRGLHNFETRDGSKFLAYVHDGVVEVRDYNGVLYSCTVEDDANEYIEALGQLAFGTVDNQVIIVNKSIVPAMLPDTKVFANKGTGSKHMGIVQVLGGAYGREYRINVDGAVAAVYRPPNGSEAPMINFVRSAWIAARLFQALVEPAAEINDLDGAGSFLKKTGVFASGYTVSRFEDIIHIQANSGQVFELSCSDDQGNVNMKAMTDKVADTADLPRIAPHGYIARIATETDPDEDMFLQFRLNVSTDSTVLGTGFGQPGFWQECVGDGVTYKIDAATMPHVLEYDPETSSFVYRKGTWKDREAGTDVSNPKPSFIGNPITDVSTFQSRLVFLAGSYVIMSKTNKYDSFWMGSAAQLVESDPIDISSTAVEASSMLAVVPHNRDLVVFSRKGQFIVYGRSALTPANATLVLTTAFEAELNAKPVPSGRNVFFATNYGRYTGIREFFTEGGTDINDTRPITQQVTKYIKGKVTKLAASSNYDTLLVLTDQDRETVYVYQYIWNDQKKVQAAWGKWVLPHPVVFAFFDEEIIYYILQNGIEFFMYRMSLDIVEDAGLDFTIHLDSRFDVENVNTQFVLPNARLATNELVAVQGANCPNPGMRVPILSVEFDAVEDYWVATLKYDMDGGDIVVGIPYKSSYWPTMPLIKDQDGVVMGTGKLRVKNFIVAIEDTGDINGTVYAPEQDPVTVSFEGRIVGNAQNQVGRPVLSSEQFVVPFREDTARAEVELFTDSFLPMTLLDIEWVGQYHKRGRRMQGGGGQQ
ncbi:tail protein [Nostoc phage NMeng1]|nr:tail protein [Nostoc phage NMeng1]